MASKKDQRRPDLVIPYQEPLSKGDNPELSSTLSQTLPMAAIFMRNRYIGWYVTTTSASTQFPRLRRRLRLGRQPGKGATTHAMEADSVRWMYRAAVVFSVQNWLGESEDSQKSNSTPGYFSVGMSLMSLVVTYLPMFLPPPPGTQRAATGTEAAAPVPPS